MGPWTDVCGLDWGIAFTDLIFMVTRSSPLALITEFSKQSSECLCP